jgi:hypothetical protein
MPSVGGIEVAPRKRRATVTDSAPSTVESTRFVVLNTFVDWTMRDLKAAEVAVWLCLYRDARDGVAETALSYIVTRTGWSLSTVRRAIKSLRSKGLLVKLSEARKGSRFNRYLILGRVSRESRKAA